MTLRSASCERLLIRLSVKPSLRYSFFASAVALTKGSTAMDSTLLVWYFPRRKYAPAPAATTTIAATQAIKYLLERPTRMNEELANGTALAAIEVLDERPESRSRFRRFRS